MTFIRQPEYKPEAPTSSEQGATNLLFTTNLDSRIHKTKSKNRSRVKYHRKSSRDPTNQKRVTGKRLKIRPPQVAGGKNNSFTKTVKYFDTSRNS